MSMFVKKLQMLPISVADKHATQPKSSGNQTENHRSLQSSVAVMIAGISLPAYSFYYGTSWTLIIVHGIGSEYVLSPGGSNLITLFLFVLNSEIRIFSIIVFTNMSLNIPVVNTCCCNFNLRTGSFIIVLIYAVSSLLVLFRTRSNPTFENSHNCIIETQIICIK